MLLNYQKMIAQKKTTPTNEYAWFLTLAGIKACFFKIKLLQ
jgi:hypothetical protein